MIKIADGIWNLPKSTSTVLYPVGRLTERLTTEAVLFSENGDKVESNFYLAVDGERIPCRINDDAAGCIGYVFESGDHAGRRKAKRLWKEFLKELNNM